MTDERREQDAPDTSEQDATRADQTDQAEGWGPPADALDADRQEASETPPPAAEGERADAAEAQAVTAEDAPAAAEPRVIDESAPADPGTVQDADAEAESPAPDQAAAEGTAHDEPSADEASNDELPDDATRIQARSELISDELAKPLAPEAPEEPTKAEPAQPRKLGDALYRPEAVAATAASATALGAASQATPTEPDDATRELSDEERKLAAERASRREAREQALAAAEAKPSVAADPVVVTRRSTDRFAGGLGLFLLRLVVAAIMLVRGLEIVTNLPAAEAVFAQTRIPEPRIMALVTGVAGLAIAVALVFGLLVRLAGLGVALIGVGALVFVQWGNWSPFVQGRSGFLGEFELLLAAVGILFMFTGGGGFGLDRSFRKSRETAKAARQVAASGH